MPILSPAAFLALQPQLGNPDENQLANFLRIFPKKSVRIRGRLVLSEASASGKTKTVPALSARLVSRTESVRVPFLVFFMKVSGS